MKKSCGKHGLLGLCCVQHTRLVRGFGKEGTAASVLNRWLAVMRGCLKERTFTFLLKRVLTFCREWKMWI